MARSKIAWLIAIPAIVALLIASPASPLDPLLFLSIDYHGSSNSLRGPISILRLSNKGDATIRLDPFCTIYWTNHLGLRTDRFIEHGAGYTNIQPGEATLVTIPLPIDANIWNSSYSFTLKPSLPARIWDTIKFWMPGMWVPDNSFYGRIGPKITNSVLNVSEETFLEGLPGNSFLHSY